jgi:hypothetical protein
LTIFSLVFLTAAAMPNIFGVAGRFWRLFELLNSFLDHAADKTFLEDFQSNAQNVQVQDENAEQLELAFTIPNDTNGLSVSDFYSQAVDNLKQKYVKLAKLRLRGGYVLKPADAVN